MNYSRPSQKVQRERADATYRSISRHLRLLAESERQASYDAIFGTDAESVTSAIGVAVGDTQFARRHIEW